MRVHAVHDLSVEVHSGEAVGIVGPNGVGKTTTILLMLGYLRPTQGRITVLGHPPGESEIRQLIGWMPDRPQIVADWTGRGLLAWWLGGHRIETIEALHRIEEMATRFGLQDSLDRPIEHYSLGMRRKLSFILATIHQPRLVILDEPYLALDFRSINEMHLVLERFRESAGTLVVASHQQAELDRIVDRRILLNESSGNA